MIKVRFAPSPTGFLHIGGARTALFNWMYAKSQKGIFVLRIEDTDQQRSEKRFEEEILDSMKWLGMDWDELYYQSERFDIYRDYAQKLIDEEKAYKEGEAVLLKVPKSQEIKIYDLIRGEIIFDTSSFVAIDENGKQVLDENGAPLIKDTVLMKSDGSPSYNFCCVVDDALMNISHVIRGEDHISNTPKQFLIYEALGFKPPKYAHLPLIMGTDGGRLSKRTGAVAVSDYRQQGFLPEALVNYLMLLGWSPGNNQEIISLDQAVKKFSIKKVNKAAAVFAMDKLKWINGEYLKQINTDDLIAILKPMLIEKKMIENNDDDKRLKRIIDLYKGRMTTLHDFFDWTSFMFVDDLTYDTEIKQEHLSINRSKEFSLLAEKFSALVSFEPEVIEQSFKNTAEELGVKPAELVHPLRAALSGLAVGPSLFEIISILGKEKTVQRLHKAFK